MTGSNRLAHEASPYLRQHAANPVHWWPWGDEARAEARRLDRPLLISIGYASCHWCHVMAHESFEDDATAAVMNALFVNVKVDREERPDVDAVYVEATQTMTGSAGWPLTIFATPDGEPFHCGTYYPPVSVHGRPSFTEVCRAVDDAWRERRGELTDLAARLTAHLQPTDLRGHDLPGADVFEDAVTTLLDLHDQAWGGFGTAPKFPQPLALDALLTHHARTGNPDALAAATTTLDAMAAGGIHDHLGGGFSRYSVDQQWLVPHFEKMLTDQALLLRVYTHAWQLTGEERYRWVVTSLVEYLARDLRHPAGGFYSAEDADSEGVEGRFYVWTPAQIRDALAGHAQLADEAITAWEVRDTGNFEGASILHRLGHRADPAGSPALAEARRLLLRARATRVRPGLDDKVLTEWNALTISALAEAGVAFSRPDWVRLGEDAADFLFTHLRDERGRWLRAWQANHGARHLAYATDHAALVDACTRLGEATGHARWFAAAREVADALLTHFADEDGAGIATTAQDAEELIARPRDIQDGATPSANSATAVALIRLAAVSGERRYAEVGESLLRLTGRFVGSHPLAFGLALSGLDLVHHGIDEVVVAGTGPTAQRMLDAVRAAWRPGAVVVWGEPDGSPLWEGRRPGVDAPDEAVTYVCRDGVCDLPVRDPEALTARLAVSH